MIETNKFGLKNKNFLSSGNLFLDKITSGFSLGSIVLMIEDSPTEIYKSFIKYFIAEGVINSEKIFFYHNDGKLCNSILKNLPYKSSQVEAILNAKKVSETKNSEIKIAWRYENIQYSNILEDIIKTTDYIFDLSRQLQDTYLIERNKEIINQKQIDSENFIQNLNYFNQTLIRDYQNYASGFSEDEKKFVRVVYPNFLETKTFSGNPEKIEKEFKLLFQALKNISRSINGIVYLTVNKDFIQKNIFNLLLYYSDYVFTIKSFLLEPQRLQDYDALFYVNKLPRLCALKTIDMETNTYGVLCEKRKVIIEKIDIGVEVDRNTKVKENEVIVGTKSDKNSITTSQAICGGKEKYSKHFEF